MSNRTTYAGGEREISHPRFAASYNRMMGRPAYRQMIDLLRRETVGQAHGLVLEIGAGGGQNFSFYDKSRVTRVEAIEPDETMLAEARRHLTETPVPITLTRAPAEALPFPDALFDCAVATLVFCSVRDPERSLREIWRVLKPGGSLLLLEHVRSQNKIVGLMQDALVPLTTCFMGNCHWNRPTGRAVQDAGFKVTHTRRFQMDFQPMLSLQAIRP